MKELMLTRPTDATPWGVHRAVYEALCPAGTQRNFIFADLGPAILVRGEFRADVAACAREVATPVAGRDYGFTLIAQPTMKKNGRARSIARTPAKDGLRLRWLERRAADHGFELVGEPNQVTDHVEIAKPGKAPFGINRTVFTGHLRVVDADAIANALASGIGAGRTYGAGFLILELLN